MNTKKYVLFVSGGSTLLVLTLFYIGSNSCYANPFCNDTFLILFLIPLPLFFLSLFTYRMKDEVFRAWWNFARWWVLVIFIATLLLNNLSGGGTIGMDKDFTAFILIIFYSILILGSLVKIIGKHRELKQGK